MTLNRKVLIAGTGVALLALVACEKNNKADETQTTGATQTQPENNPAANNNQENKPLEKKNQVGVNTPDPNQAIIQKVTQARCQREMACGEVGNGKKYATEADCVSDLGKDTFEDLKAKECKTPMQDKVNDCVAALPKENCDNVRSDLSHILACRAGAICKD